MDAILTKAPPIHPLLILTMVQVEEVPSTTTNTANNNNKNESNNMNNNNDTIPTTTRTQDAVDQFNTLFCDMQQARDDPDVDPDNPLTQAIELALAQGRGWGPGEKQAYLEKILADDFLPPLFASNVEEVEATGLKDAFTTLQTKNGENDDGNPCDYMGEFKKKGNKAFADGKRNQVSNVQYFRDAINEYYKALAWSEQVQVVPQPMTDDSSSSAKDAKETKEETTPQQQQQTSPSSISQHELDTFQSTLYSNIALCHMQLKNWGLCRQHAQLALQKDPNNDKANFRLCSAWIQLQEWDTAEAAMDEALLSRHNTEDDPMRKDWLRLQSKASQSIQRNRRLRQQRERARAERVHKVKAVYQHCQRFNIQLGRVPLVATDDDDDDDDAAMGGRHPQIPHSGLLPSSPTTTTDSDSAAAWSWPCLCLYPSHQQSDLWTDVDETELLAVRMAHAFPELEDTDTGATQWPWDTDNVFTCSQLAVYFHVAAVPPPPDNNNNTNTPPLLLHPDAVHPITDQASCMRLYETTRALRGDEGPDMSHIVQLAEMQRRQRQQAAWRKRYGSLHAQAPHTTSTGVVRVHPAMTLLDILQDPRMIVPNVRSTCACYSVLSSCIVVNVIVIVVVSRSQHSQYYTHSSS